MSLTREHFEQLTKSSPDIIVGTDRKGRVVYFNDGAHASLGYEEEEVIGQFVGLFYPSVKEARRVKQWTQFNEALIPNFKPAGRSEASTHSGHFFFFSTW